jgi:hypothetical protein
VAKQYRHRRWSPAFSGNVSCRLLGCRSDDDVRSHRALGIGGSRSIVTGRKGEDAKGEDAMAFADKINGNMQQQGDVT